MSTSPRNISVSLMGKDYMVACPAEAEAELLKAAAYLNQKMQEIKASGRIIGTEKVAVMAALNIAYELHNSLACEQQTISNRLGQLSQLIEAALPDSKTSAS